MEEKKEKQSKYLKESKEFHIRKMDDLGRVPIPEDIQKAMGIKKSELPSFEVKIHESKGESYIGLHLQEK